MVIVRVVMVTPLLALNGNLNGNLNGAGQTGWQGGRASPTPTAASRSDRAGAPGPGPDLGGQRLGGAPAVKHGEGASLSAQCRSARW
jgi:hypothetical protein